MVEQLQDASIGLVDAEDHGESALAAIGELSNGLPPKMEIIMYIHGYISCVLKCTGTQVLFNDRDEKPANTAGRGGERRKYEVRCHIFFAKGSAAVL